VFAGGGEAVRKTLVLVVGLLAASAASAQGGPVVKENTGDLSYVYPFELPPARGKVQPPLALIYSTTRKLDLGYGVGWALAPFYIDPPRSSESTTAILVRGEKRDAFEFISYGGTHFASNKEGLSISWVEGGYGYAMADSEGRTWNFFTKVGERYYLTQITDPDGNAAAFVYSGTRLWKVYYNLLTPRTWTYPNVVGDESYWANMVQFYSSGNYGPQENVAGTLVRPIRLTFVSVRGQESAPGVRPELRRYTVAYTGDDLRAIGSITEEGMNSAPSRTTTFTYDQALDLSLGFAQTVTSFPSTDSFELRDLDGDGFADLRMGTQWARSSVSAPGQAPTFGSVNDILRSSTGGPLSGASSGEFVDFNGDGAIDFMRTQAPECTAFGAVLVRFGKADLKAVPTVGLSFDDYACVDASNAYTALSNCGYPFNAACTLSRQDLNGDKILDFLVRDAPGHWTAFLTKYWSTASPPEWLASNQAELSSAAGERFVTALHVETGVELEALDINGDGFVDGVLHNRHLPGCPLYASQPTSEYGAYPVKLSLWPSTTNDNGIYASLGWNSSGLGLAAFLPSNWGWQYPEVAVNGLTMNSVACQSKTRDPRVAKWWSIDANGDDVPDWLRQTSSSTVGLTMTTGWGSAPERSVSSDGSLVPRGRYISDPLVFSEYAFTPSNVAGESCSGTVALSGGATPFAQFMDLDGDGIPDYFTKVAGSSQPTFRRGSYTKTDAGNPENTLAVARPLLLKSVTSPNGAVVKFSYLSSRAFGDRSATRPVVTEVEVTGSRLPSGMKTKYRYGYEENLSQLRLSFRGAGQVENTGFRFTWVHDVARAWVRKTTWRVDDVAFEGLSSSAIEGPVVANSNPPNLAEASPARDVVTTWTKCGTGEAVTATNVRATTYYDTSGWRIGAGTEQIVSCSDVTPRKTVTKSTTREFMVEPGGYTRYWPSVTREMRFYKAETTGGGYINYIRDGEPAPTPSSPCGGVADKVESVTYSGSDPGGRLNIQTEIYELATCRKVAEFAGDGKFRKDYTYRADFGLLETVTSPDTKTTFEYQDNLRLTRESTIEAPGSGGGSAVLEKAFEYDPSTGWLLRTTGPRLTSGSGSDQATTRCYIYDGFGRRVATSKEQGTPGGTSCPAVFASTASQVVEATSYDPSGLKVTSFRFASPATVGFTSQGPLLGTPSDSPDVIATVAHLDQLGRTIQTTERLSVDGASWRVASSTEYDPAGRVRNSWEPFFSATGAYVIPSTGRVSVNLYDERGRLHCVVNRHMSGSVVLGSTTCTSSPLANANYQLATEMTYGAMQVTGDGNFGGWFLYSSTKSPLQKELGAGSTVTLMGPNGAILGSIDAEGRRLWIDRDPLGREVLSWREQPGPGGGRSPNPGTSRVYLPDTGQLDLEVDANGGSRQYEYDAAGRLQKMWIGTTGRHVKYTYNNGDTSNAFGRVSRIQEYETESEATAQRTTTYGYERPYVWAGHPEGQYGYTAGRQAYADTTGVTTIAYSYDDAGRLGRRDQWLANLNPTTRFIVTSSYGGDGRVLGAGVNGPMNGSGGLSYAVTYDAAGRPIVVSGSYEGSEQSVFYEAADAGPGLGRFDELGRPRVLQADDGQSVSVRRYNEFTGNLSMECKRLGGGLTCEGSQWNSALDLYRTDAVGSTTTEATYTGGLLKSYRDLTSDTSVDVTYLPSGKVSRVTAVSRSGVSLLGQDFDESYTFDALGNVKSTSTKTDWDTNEEAWSFDRVDSVEAESPASGEILDRAQRIVTTNNAGSPAAAKSVTYGFDTLNRLSTITRDGELESLAYGPSGELVMKKVGEKYWFYVGGFATVTASGAPGCGAACTPQSSNAVLDAHVIFGGTRIASLKASRTLYYYRSRLGTVVATSLNGGRMGMRYRYSPYGVLEKWSRNDDIPVSEQESELGYTNALRLGGVETQGQYAGRLKEDLIHLMTRAYDPETKQFLQPDSSDPKRYAYAGGDPINMIDPSGKSPRVGDEGALTVILDGSILDDPYSMAPFEEYASSLDRQLLSNALQGVERAERWAALGVMDWWGQGVPAEYVAHKGTGATGASGGVPPIDPAIDAVDQAELARQNSKGWRSWFRPNSPVLPVNRASKVYDTPDEAAKAAHEIMYKYSVSENLEYGYLVVAVDGGYSFTRFVRGGTNDVQMRVSTVGRVVGYGHSHAAYDMASSNVKGRDVNLGFSDADYMTGVRNYLTTATGALIVQGMAYPLVAPSRSVAEASCERSVMPCAGQGL